MDTLLDLNTCFNQHVAISPTNLARAIRCATMKRFLALWLVLFLASLHLAEGQNTPQGCKTDSDCGAGQVCKGGLYCMAGNNPSTTTSANTNGASNNAGGGGSGTEVINCTIQTLNQCGSDWATRFKQPLILGLVIGGGVLVLILVPTIVCCIVKGACCAARTAAKTSAGVVGGVAKGMAAGVSGAGGGGGGDGGHAHMEGRDRRLAPPSQAQINDHRERNYGGIGSGAYSPSNWNGARNDDKGALPNLHNSNPRRSDPRNYEAYDAPVRQRSLPRNNNTNGPAPLPEGYRRAPQFPLDDDPAVIAARAREERDREYNRERSRERSPRRARSTERRDVNTALQQGAHQPSMPGGFAPQGQQFVPMMSGAPIVMVPQQQPYGYMAAAPQPVYGYAQPQQAFIAQQQAYGYPQQQQQQQPLYPPAPGSQFQQPYNAYNQPGQNLSPPAPSALQSMLNRDPTSPSSNTQTFVDSSPLESDSVNYNSLTPGATIATQSLPRDAPPTYRRTAPRDVKPHPTLDAELTPTSQDTPARHSLSSSHIESPILSPSHRADAEDDVISGYLNDDDASSRDESLLRPSLPGVAPGTVARNVDPATVAAGASVRRERGSSEAASHARLQQGRRESREVVKRNSAEVRLFAQLSAEEKRLSSGEAAALLNQNWKRRSREVEFPAGSKRNSAALRGSQTGSDGSGSTRAAAVEVVGRGLSRERTAEGVVRGASRERMPAVVPAIPEPIIPGSYTPRPRTGEAVQQQQQQYPVTAVQQRPRAAVNGPQEQVPPIHRVNTAPTVNSQVQYRSQEPIRDFKESVAPLKSIEDSRGRARLPAQSSSFAVPPPPVDDPRNGGRIMAPQDKLSFQEDSRGRGRQGPESFQDRDRSVAPAGRIPFDSSRNQSVAPMGRVPMQQQPTLRDMSPATHGATDGYRSRAR